MRRRRLTHACSGLTAAACLTLLLAVPGHAATPADTDTATGVAPAAPAAHAFLRLEIHKGESPYGQLLAQATLRCDPDSGSHPHPQQACAALATVDGHIERLQPLHVVCSLIFDPVTAVATGHWNGRPVSFVHTYGNRCELGRATGPVFTF